MKFIKINKRSKLGGLTYSFGPSKDKLLYTVSVKSNEFQKF